MTVIAYQSGIIAADRLVMAGRMVAGYTTKIFITVDHAVIGFAGPLTWSQSADMSDPYFGLTSCPEDACAMRISPEGHYEELGTEGWFTYGAPHYAIGQGELVAKAAMMAGSSAYMAVEVACDLMPGSCGGGIDRALILNGRWVIVE